MLEQNKKVYLYGLDGDFNRNKFGQMLDLIPFCDNIQKLHAKCNSCNLDAIFSHRITSESSQVVIGSEHCSQLTFFSKIQGLSTSEIIKTIKYESKTSNL
jgi:thymidine kinase